MEQIIKTCLNMSQMDYNFNRFYGRWSIFHSLLNIAGIFTCILWSQINIWLIGASLSFLMYIWHIPKYSGKMNSIISYANWITIFRLFLIIAAGFFLDKFDHLLLFFLFLLAIFLDGVDGYVARKYNQSSVVGENLDMETDAFMVALLSYIHFMHFDIPWWIILSGGLRYYSELIFIKTNKGEQKDLPKKIRSTIAVIFFVSLLTPFILSSEVSFILLAISSLFIVLSFVFSIATKLRGSLSN